MDPAQPRRRWPAPHAQAPADRASTALAGSTVLVETQDVVLQCLFGAGDNVVVAAALESLHLYHPGKFRTDVTGCVASIFEHHPRVTRLKSHRDVLHVPMNIGRVDGPSLADRWGMHRASQTDVTFLQAMCDELAHGLGLPRLPCLVNRPVLHLSQRERNRNVVAEKTGHAGDYVVLVSGGRVDPGAWMTKHNDPATYQEVVDRLEGHVKVVLVGSGNDDSAHPRLRGAIDLVGQTNERELMMVLYRARLGVGPITFPMHLAGALNVAWILVDAPREPTTWITYPNIVNLVPYNRLPCGPGTGCWAIGLDQCQNLTPGSVRDVPACYRLVSAEQIATTITTMLANPALGDVNKVRYHVQQQAKRREEILSGIRSRDRD